MSDLSMTRDAMIRPVVSELGRRVACLCALALVALLGWGVSVAGAVGVEPEAENFIPQFSEYGSGAGQLSGPRGLGVSPVTGDVYVTDAGRVSEFTPWGHFVRAFGWGVADGVSEEPQVCTTTCFAGLNGTGAGEFNGPWAIAVDASGVYVRETADARIQKFSPSGQFLLMFGGAVNKTEVSKREEQEAKAEPVTVTAQDEDVCTAASGDQCGAGSEGLGHGQVSAQDGGLDIGVSPGGTVLVPRKEGVEEFEADGTYKSEVELPGTKIHCFGVDPTNGDFYIDGGSGGGGNVTRLSPSGTPIGVVTIVDANQLAVDTAGHLFVNADGRIVEFDAAGKQLSEFAKVADAFGEAEFGGFGTSSIGDLYVSHSAAANIFDPAVSYVSAYGPGPLAFEPPPPVPPTIDSEYVLSAEENGAVVQAQINPRFWNDTTYYVQYGTGDCEVSSCAALPAAPGSRLTTSGVSASILTGGIVLSGLQAGTTYHYRFVAVSSGGGPVFGPDHTFTTFPVFAANTGCANQAFRTATAKWLADCRAYEMVSPVDKGNGELRILSGERGYEFGVDMSATNGDRFTYSSYRAFGDAKASPFVSQYMADRDPVTGWSTQAISPEQRIGSDPLHDDEPAYKLFSPDLSNAWLVPSPEPALAPGAVEGFHTLYRRDNGSGEFDALSTVKPPTTSSPDFEVGLEGVSRDGSHAVFRADGMLTPDASSAKGPANVPVQQLYESYGEGETRLVSVLPNGLASGLDSSVGSFSGIFGKSSERLSTVAHAVSDDGSRVYWSEVAVEGPGKIYLRENADREQSAIGAGGCLEPDKACTVPVAGKASQFWTATPDGSRALYTIKEGSHTGDLEEFNVEEGTSTRLAGQVTGVVGASEDLSYIYFVSNEALAPGGEAGQPNVYLSHEGATTFVATLATRDIHDFDFTDISRRPVEHAGRVTPDGLHMAFMSTASLTGYDNADAVSGKADAEVYLYDASSNQLACVSCDRSGARPTGGEHLSGQRYIPLAAWIPGWMNEFHAPGVLSDAGDRVFFNSFASLVPRDGNGKQDVYEWEAVGSGDCTAQNPAFSTTNAGCVSLISSGESPQDSSFVDATPTGSDAFFITTASLSPQDSGLTDLYDARVGGGFPRPAVPAAVCEGEACQGAPVPPTDQTPASLTFSGPGDLVSPLTATVTPKNTVAQAKRLALAKALKACRTRSKPRHLKSCETAARKRYGAKAKRRAGKANKRGN